jgi:hypothetical protein
MKIGIVGSRRRNSQIDKKILLKAFKSIYKEGDTIVSGGCPTGGDRFAEEIASEYGLPITIHYPNWNKLGRAAGFIRNSQIANDCDILLALIAEDRTGGTEDTVRKTNKLNKKIVLL